MGLAGRQRRSGPSRPFDAAEPGDSAARVCQLKGEAVRAADRNVGDGERAVPVYRLCEIVAGRAVDVEGRDRNGDLGVGARQVQLRVSRGAGLANGDHAGRGYGAARADGRGAAYGATGDGAA